MRFSLVLAAVGAALAAFITVMSWLHWSPGNPAVLVANLVVLALLLAFGVVFATDSTGRTP